MVIKRIFSPNVVIALDDAGRECVLMGKGIAFGRKVGDRADSTQIEKIFAPKEKGMAEKLSGLLERVPMEYVKVCDEIINMAKKALPGMTEVIYLSLIDHMTYAITRFQKGLSFASSLTWEMQRFYAKEFEIGLRALDIIEHRLGLRLPADEAGFFAFHFVNAGAGNASLGQIQASLQIIKDILDIIQLHYGVEFDQTSYEYSRFLTHLKYFSLRVFHLGKPPKVADSDFNLLTYLRAELPDEDLCVDKIARYVQDSYDHVMNDAEKAYLIVHIQNLLQP